MLDDDRSSADPPGFPDLPRSIDPPPVPDLPDVAGLSPASAPPPGAAPAAAGAAEPPAGKLVLPGVEAGGETLACLQCGRSLDPREDHESTEQGVFCRPCFTALTAQLEQALAQQGAGGVNYPLAVLGGCLGGALGALVWWGFTVITNIAFGLVAIIIGIAVGKGIVLLSGGRRARSLQLLSVGIAAAAYFYAQFLVNRTFAIRWLAEHQPGATIPWLPDPQLFYEVVKLSFGAFDLFFLAIVVYEAWRIPAPLRLRT